MYTHLDGAHSRIRIGEFKIGRIARRREPHLTNNVREDEEVSDRDWAVREGLVAFAGYPLLVEGRLTGVLGLFSKTPLAPETVDALSSVSAALAQSIERVRAEFALRENERRFRATFEQAAVGLGHVALDGRWIAVNDRLCEMLGFSRDELLGTTLNAITHPEDRALASFDRLVSGERDHQSADLRGIRKDRTPLWIRLTASLARKPDGAIEYAIVVVEDISRRKDAERAADAEQSFRRAIESSMRAGVLAVDLDGRFSYSNAAFLRMTGWPVEELLDRYPPYPFWPPEEAEHYGALFQRTLAAPEATPSFELTFRRRNDERFPVLLMVSNLRTGERITGLVASVYDLTDRKRVEEELRQAQKLEALGQLAGGIAHDFNNLLTIVSGYADLMSLRLPRDHDFQGDIAEIRKAAESAAALTRQLLTFSRRQILQVTTLDVNAVIRRAETMLRRLVPPNIEIEIELAPVPAVRADAGQVEQVILNLIVNARDAMPQGGRVRIATAPVILPERLVKDCCDLPPGDYVVVTVADTGHGIPAEVMPRLFDPFFTTKESTKGTGLGLAAVHRIARQSGGGVWAENAAAGGAVFFVYFPAAGANASVPPPDAASSESLRGYESVLLVEDNTAVRQLAERSLARYGYAVLSAENAAQAVALFDTHAGPIDILVTDVVMPGLSGPALARRLLATRPSLRVLFISAYPNDQTLLAEGLPILAKPFTAEQLARRVRGVLDEPPVPLL